MKYRNHFIVSLAAIAPLAALAQQTITISPLNKTHIQVEYQLPKQCTETKLQERYEGRAPGLRKDWQPLDNCSLLSNGDTISMPKGCHRSRFSVPMSTAFIDRVEPVAYPMDDLGVRVHTGTFGLTDTCGDTTWIFSSPNGSVVMESGVYSKRAKASLSKEDYLNYTGVYLSYKPMKKGTQQVFTKTVPPELITTFKDGQQKLSDYYQKTYPTIPFTSAFLLVDNIISNGFGSQAEVTSPHMIRIGYVGWSPERITDTRHMQAHEYAHLLQPKRNASTSPFFHEGGAEFISLKANYHLGWISKDTFSENISSAIQSCINLSDNKKWDELKYAFGRIPYTCGLAMHILALASRQQPETAEQTLAQYYASKLDDAHFAQAIECGSLPVCTPVFTTEFTGNTKSITSVIIGALERLKLVTHLDYASPTDHYNSAASTAFANLMIEDCKGTDFYTKQNYFQTGDMLTCNSIPKNSTISTINGIDYFANPDAAIDAQNQGCSANHKVVLGDGKNATLEIPCTKTTPKTYYSIDIDKLLMLLDKRATH